MRDEPRQNLEGVDATERSSPWRSLSLLVRDPAEWSARRYQSSSTMSFSALWPTRWRKPS